VQRRVRLDRLHCLHDEDDRGGEDEQEHDRPDDLRNQPALRVVEGEEDAAGEAEVVLARIVDSETEAPTMLANPV
jgi:hypothetical protein